MAKKSKKKSVLNIGVNHISNADYHADLEYLSSSNLKLLLKDREQFYQEKVLGNRPPQSENAAFDEGSYAHALILDPGVIDDEFAFFEGNRKIGDDWARFSAHKENEGKIILSKPQVLRCQQYFDAYKRNPVAAKFVDGGFAEHTLCHILNDVPIKVRCDYINPDKGYIADVKTTGYSVDVDTFRQTVEHWGYELSAALYCMIAEIEYGRPFDFYFIAIDKKNKHCEVYKLSMPKMQAGKAKVIEALNIYKKCLETGDWSNPPKLLEEIVHSTEYEILEI